MFFYNLVNYTVHANGYDETAVNATVANYSNIQAGHQDIIEALGRLFIAQKALDEMSNDARDMCAEIAVSSFDLGEGIYNLFTVKKKLLELTANAPFAQILQQILGQAFELASHILESALIQGCNFIQDNAVRANTISELQGVFDGLKVMAEGGNLLNVTAEYIADIAKDYITHNLAARLYSNSFVSSTQHNVQIAAYNADNLNYSGTFDAAYDNVIENSSNSSIVETGHQNTIVTKNQIGDLRIVSDVASATSQISQITAVALTLTGFGAVVNGVLQPLILATTILDVGASGWAIAKGANRTRHIKTELGSATLQSYALVSVEGQPYSGSAMSLSDDITNYNNQLLYINDLISANQRLDAINEVQPLLHLDSAMQASTLDAIMPIYAASPFANLTNYDDTLNNVVVNDFAISMQTRQAVGYALAAYILDSLSTSVVTDLQDVSNDAIDANNQLATSINGVNNDLSGTIVPPHILVST